MFADIQLEERKKVLADLAVTQADGRMHNYLAIDELGLLLVGDLIVKLLAQGRFGFKDSLQLVGQLWERGGAQQLIDELFAHARHRMLDRHDDAS
jgi:hypothetical protein